MARRPRVQVDVGLVEPVEEHEAVRSRGNELGREVRHRRVVRTELHGERDVDLAANRRDDVEVPAFDVGGGGQRVGSDVVQVALDRISAGLLHEPRVAGPASCRRRVEARKDGNLDARLDLGEIGEIPLTGVGELGYGREVVECLGEVLGPGLEGAVHLDLVVEDLLLEQRREHDRGRTGFFELAHEIDVAVRGDAEATIGDRSSSPR